MDTRDEILKHAMQMVLSEGFDRTTINRVAEQAGVSRSGVFYHFADKTALAESLMHMFMDENNAVFDRIFAEARHLSDDPLHAFLIGLKMLQDVFTDLPDVHPGCLVAMTVYQERLYEARVHSLTRRSSESWRRRFRHMLDEITEVYPPNTQVDLDDLADMLGVCIDGGIILSKAHQAPELIAAQIGMYRSVIKLMFAAGRG